MIIKPFNRISSLSAGAVAATFGLCFGATSAQPQARSVAAERPQGRRRGAAVLASLALGISLAASPAAHADSARWNNVVLGDWSLDTNWTPVTVPNAQGDTATGPTGTASAYTTIVDGTFTVGTITAIGLGSGSAAWTLQKPASGTSLLILDNGANTALIQVSGGTTTSAFNGRFTLTVNPDIQINSDLQITKTIAKGVNINRDLTLNGNITGSRNVAITSSVSTGSSTTGISSAPVVLKGTLNNTGSLSINGIGTGFTGSNNGFGRVDIANLGSNVTTVDFAPSNAFVRFNLTGTDANAYTGGTTLTGGETNASKDGVFGTGNVTVNGGPLSSTTTLNIGTGTTNNHIDDFASLLLNGVAGTETLVNLNYTGTDTIFGLFFNNVAQEVGTYGAVGSEAMFTSAYFGGTGMFLVVPEPGTATMLLGGCALLLGFRRSRPRSRQG